MHRIGSLKMFTFLYFTNNKYNLFRVLVCAIPFISIKKIVEVRDTCRGTPFPCPPIRPLNGECKTSYYCAFKKLYV